MDASTRRTLIDQYRAGYAAVVDALAGADDAALDRRPGPGAWSAREIVHHLADSEMTSAIRLRRLIAGAGRARDRLIGWSLLRAEKGPGIDADSDR